MFYNYIFINIENVIKINNIIMDIFHAYIHAMQSFLYDQLENLLIYSSNITNIHLL